MTKGTELLRAWRKAHEISQLDAAVKLEIGQSTLCDYEYGRKLPGVVIALRIASVTDGAVPVESWGEPPTDVEAAP